MKLTWITLCLWVLVFFAVFTAVWGCAPTVRQCRIPVMVVAHESMGLEEQLLLEKATEYWNTALDAPAFIYMGTTDAAPTFSAGAVYAVVGRPRDFTVDADVLARTQLMPDPETGCVASQWVELYYAPEIDPSLQMTILRHELAHALGGWLQNSHRKGPGFLMSESMGWVPPGGLVADEYEIRTLKALLPSLWRRDPE